MTLLLVFAGGVLGAPIRYVLDRSIQSRHDSVFPFGTLAVNLIGSLLLGILLATAPPGLLALAGTGFCGALTTFSTFGFETLRLLEEGSLAQAGLNALGSLTAGIAAALAGYLLGGLL